MSGALGYLALTPRNAGFALGAGSAGVMFAAALGRPDEAAVGVILSYALAWLAFIDLERFVLPDGLTLGLVLIGVALSWLPGGVSPVESLIGAGAGWLVVMGVRWTYARVRRRNGIGMGDAKLLAAGGAWLGWEPLPLVVLVASSTALVAIILLHVILRRQIERFRRHPFGPFLALGIFAVWMTGLGG